jgi:hypothetical protein
MNYRQPRLARSLLVSTLALLVLGGAKSLEAQPTAEAFTGAEKDSDEEKLVSPENRKVLSVLVTGVGLDFAQAKRNALQRALEQVLGTMVSSDTLIKNRELVREQVLVYQRGDVESAKILKNWEEDGLHHVRAEITVVIGNLVEKLSKQNIAMREVAGEQLYVGAKYKELNKKNAKKMLINALEQYTPETLYNLEVVGEPTVVSQADGMAKVAVKVKVQGNLDAWRGLRANLGELLSRTSKARVINESTDKLYSESGFHSWGGSSRVNHMYYQLQEKGKEWGYWLYLAQSYRKQSEPGVLRSQWECYWVDPSIDELMKNLFAKKLQMRVRLLDATEDAIAEQTKSITASYSREPLAMMRYDKNSSWKSNYYWLGPFLWSGGYYAVAPPAYEFEFEMKLESVKDIKLVAPQLIAVTDAK